MYWPMTSACLPKASTSTKVTSSLVSPVSFFQVRLTAKADLGDRHAFGRVAQFRVAGQIPDQDDFVEAGHSDSRLRSGAATAAAALGTGALVNSTRNTSSFIAKRCFSWLEQRGLAFENDVHVETRACASCRPRG